jgi:hypothetical protein
VAAEKLRGFVADHHAEIVAIDEDHVVLHLEVQNDAPGRRRIDRAVPFQIELRFAEIRIEAEDGKPQQSTRTLIRAAVRPRRNRDRRRRDAIDRARLLVSSVKSYLMAQDYNHKKPTQAAEVEEVQKTRGWRSLFVKN